MTGTTSILSSQATCKSCPNDEYNDDDNDEGSGTDVDCHNDDHN